MKKLLLSLSLSLVATASFAQSIYSYGFDAPTASLATDGWIQTNQSDPVGASTYIVPATASTVFTTGGQAGGPLSMAIVNYNSTTGAGIISNWLITPTITVKQGDVISFYTRTATYNVAPTPANTFPDRLELRGSANGDFSVIPSGGADDLGDFGELLVSVNPDLDLTGYPDSWTQYSFTITGFPTETAVKLALRYYVTDGGPTGANSNIIAIDSFNVDRPLSTDGFFAQNYKVWPNPASTVLNFANNATSTINSIQITDLNGRTVKEVKGMVEQINISELNAGLYFVKVNSNEGTGTTKIIKK